MDSDSSAQGKLLFVMQDGTEINAGRVLIFNEAFNVYDDVANDYKGSILLADAVLNETANGFAIQSKTTQQLLLVPRSHPAEKELRTALAQHQKGWFQKVVRHPASLWFILFGIFVVGFYMALISLVPYMGMRLIGADTEISIGQQLKTVALEEEKLSGHAVDSLATTLLQKFTKQLELSTVYPINVTVVNSDQVNAYAIPGGQIIVYSGILEKMPNYAALTALLSHEAAHITERHTLRSMLRRTANSIVLAVILGDVAGVTGSLGNDLGGLYGLKYSRTLESEADEVGMAYMTKNNVDPAGMKDLMKVLSDSGSGGAELAFLSTHPMNNERIENAERFMRRTAVRASGRADLNAIFNDIKASLSKPHSKQW